MPAKLQEMLPVPASADGLSGAGVGFGKVLNSIQGLQQRLDDFSVEEVLQASARAESLIQELSAIQSKLGILPPLNQFISDTNRILSDIPEESSAQTELSNLETYPTLNRLLAVAHQLHQAVRACPEGPMKSEPAELIALPVPGAEILATSTGQSVAALSHSERMQTDADDKARLNPNAGSWRDADFSVHVDEQTSHDAGQVAAGGNFSVGGNSEFDQRLLNDVIQSYGDFAGIAKNPLVPKKPKALQNRAIEKKSAPSPMSERQTSAVETENPKALTHQRSKTKPASLPKVAPAEIIPILETQQSRPAAESLPSASRHGELDRQLKNIIKDYGEYDLYPRRNTMNVKIAGIVAFALLGLVLLGFYLFKTPTPVTNGSTYSTGQPNTTSSVPTSDASALGSTNSTTKTTKQRN